MSALYQRARPVRFDEVVGQEHVKSVLLAGVRSGRTGHAYLFSGPRGVGKTTTARLLAMAVNCDHEDLEQRPCGVCESCRMVQSGSHPDVFELDAASNNSVEDVRDLREKVHLASLRGGVRVWILDEAHMLTKAAANALLKTLEEPPPGSLFVLATTEPEKLPATVLSRCQHFRFRRLSDAEISGKLAALCEAAGVSAEPDALQLVAQAADGGMRDAESMLERLLVVEGSITLEDAEGALGLPPRDRLQALALGVSTGAIRSTLETAEGLYRDGFSPRTLAEQLGRCLRDALYEQVKDGTGFRLPLDDAALMRLIHALDDDMERFVRHGDLYALEVTLIKGINATTRNSPVADAQANATADATSPVAVAGHVAPPAGTSAPAPAEARASGGGSAKTRATSKGARPKADARADTEVDTTADTKADTKAGAGADTQARPARTPPPDPDAFDPHAPTPRKSTEPEPTEAALRSGGRASAPGAEKSAAQAGAQAGAQPARQAGAEPGGAVAGARALSWHAVKSSAGPQLKAFLKPAQESIEGHVVTLTYGPSGRFHFEQLLTRGAELEMLIEDIAGPGYTVLVEGPDGGTPKKL